MDYKTLIGLTSALVGGSVVGGQDPSFEYPAVQPKNNPEPILAAGVPTAPSAHRDIELTGVSPMAGFDRVMVTIGQAVPAPLALTTDLPQDPQHEKELKELHEKMMKEFGPDSEFMRKLRQELGDSKKWHEHAKELQGRAGEHKMSEQDAKKWEQFHKDMERRFGEGSEFQKKMKVWSEQHAKEMEKRFGEGSEFQKKMKVWSEQNAKEMEKRFGEGSEFQKKFKIWRDKDSKEFEMQFGPGSDFAKKMKAFKYENGKMRELTPKEQAELEKKMSEMRIRLKDMPMPPMDFKFNELPFQKAPGTPKAHAAPKMPAMPKIPDGAFKVYSVPAMPKIPDGAFKVYSVPAIPPVPSVPGKLAVPAVPQVRFKSTDLMDVAKSLTPAQREKNKAQGYLYWSDLNKEQQNMLGVHGWTGNWTITYNKDGETFTVKSDRK